MAEMLLKALIYYLIATRPEEEQNLASCAELVRAANKNGGSDDITYTAVFLLPISSKSIVSVDVNSAISFESNFPNFDCNELWN